MNKQDELRDTDRLVKFAEMMLGQLKDARRSVEAAGMVHKAMRGRESMSHEVQAPQFARLIQMGERALEPFRHELTPSIKVRD